MNPPTHLKLVVQALVAFGQGASFLDRVLDVLVGVEVLRVVPRGSVLGTVRQLLLVVLLLFVDVVVIGGGRGCQQSRRRFVLRLDSSVSFGRLWMKVEGNMKVTSNVTIKVVGYKSCFGE